jgi:putative ABC transport system permease protein
VSVAPLAALPSLPLAAVEVIDPGWAGLGLAALMMVLVVGAALASGVRLVRLGLTATARTFGQLLAIGVILEWVFGRSTWLWIITVLGVMTLIAGWTGSGRVERRLRGTGPALTIILACVLAATLLYVTEVVLGVGGPSARYLIPLGGMILGNAMTAGSLAAQRFHDDLRTEREVVQAALCLGASPAQATGRITRRALLAAMTPILNAMMIVGVVKLPGMMTGQMLGGSAPFVAAKYQIVVMCMLAFGDGLTALGILWWLRRRAFTPAWQPLL